MQKYGKGTKILPEWFRGDGFYQCFEEDGPVGENEFLIEKAKGFSPAVLLCHSNTCKATWCDFHKNHRTISVYEPIKGKYSKRGRLVKLV